ncbi:outer membrane protein assembly factor BamB family protein [Rhodopirellula bahusiensis]|uniref:Pyrrolo-quinoline quinone n=1 Tax=Rhodopirellula bahusiensis TaxID=2014065 RepID=A0A2G1W6Y9_9BACT|nr:PQQ-binding-like beta-propeller repeat protein [Rhodopirellula bahusiensis]PHQ34600.1 pyrrolo-quinoline quinone [Rhodopirellula bahusiensis]
MHLSRRSIQIGLIAAGIGLTSSLAAPSAFALDWLQFRGSDTTSSSSEVTPIPVNDSIEPAWEVPTSGRGISSPIVIGDSVVVTSSGGEDERDLYVESFSAADGTRQWQRTLHALGRPYTHPTSANASPSPASDGEKIIALFSSCDLVCLRTDGTPLWYRALAVDHPRTGNDVSMSSSPVILDDVVAVQLENQGDSFGSGIDLETGETLWTRPRPRRSGWATPIAVRLPDPAFVFQNSDGIEIVAARSGELIATLDISGSTTSSPTWAPPLLLVPGNGITAFNLREPEFPIAWENTRLNCRSVSPVVHNGQVIVNQGSVIASADFATGESTWKTRMRKVKSVWATPIATASGIYVVDQSGTITVVGEERNGVNGDASDSGEVEVLGTAEFTGPMLATPAVSDGSVFLRSDRSLIKLAHSTVAESRTTAE